MDTRACPICLTARIPWRGKDMCDSCAALREAIKPEIFNKLLAIIAAHVEKAVREHEYGYTHDRSDRDY